MGWLVIVNNIKISQKENNSKKNKSMNYSDNDTSRMIDRMSNLILKKLSREATKNKFRTS